MEGLDIEQVKDIILKRLTKKDRAEKAFYIDRKIAKAGTELVAGPHKHPIQSDSIVVFIDEMPEANWAHPCRYLLFDIRTGKVTEIAEQFPPSLIRLPETVEVISKPRPKTAKEWLEEREKRRQALKKQTKGSQFFRRIEDVSKFFGSDPPGKCDKRWAILFSGDSNRRHLDDLEFMYRTLVNTYGYDPAHITVLNYDGTAKASDWTGNYVDGSAFTMVVNGQGTRGALVNALNTVGSLLDMESTLFIMTNNHGYESGGEYYLCCYSGADFSATDMSNCLTAMPTFKELLVAMEQCHSGGFIDPIINHSRANRTSVATACRADRSSIGGPEFDPWALDWITAVNKAGPTPSYPLVEDPDYNGDGGVSAYSAFAYSITWKDPYDTPQYKDSPQDCGQTMFLGWPDLHIKDATDDDGAEPYPGPLWWDSPDIWIQDASGNPLGNSPIGGQWNQVWVRVRNIGCAAARNIHIFYYAFPFGLIGATEQLVGIRTVPEIPSGGYVEERAWWFVPPWYTHCCVRVRVGCQLDPIKSTTSIPQDNNQAQKNLTVVWSNPGGWTGIWVDVDNPFNEEQTFSIAIEPVKDTEAFEAIHGPSQFESRFEGLAKGNTISLKPWERKRFMVRFQAGGMVPIGHRRRYKIYAKDMKGKVLGGVVIVAQVATATLAIAVRDELKKPLAKAFATLKPTHLGAEYSGSTDERGICVFRDIGPGRYDVKIAKDGFETITETIYLAPHDKREYELVLPAKKVDRWWIE